MVNLARIEESSKQSPKQNSIVIESGNIQNNKKEKGFIMPNLFNSHDIMPKMNVEDELRRSESTPYSVRKKIRPRWFYHTPFGIPRGINPSKIRILASSWIVQSCISVYQSDLRSMKYDIIAKDSKMAKDKVVIDIATDIKEGLLKVNDDGESIQDIWEKWIKDVLEVDAGVFVSHYTEHAYIVFSDNTNNPQKYVPENVKKGNLLEVTAEDGALFYKDFWEDGKLMGYWQHNFTGGMPTFFGKQEISYTMFNPSTYSPYGWSKVQQLNDILISMIASVLNTSEFTSRGALPPGIIELRGADADEAAAFRDYWRNKVQGSSYKFAIIGSPEDGQINFIPLNFDIKDITFLEGLDFYWRIVMATFHIAPNELGITDTVNKSTSESQERVNKRTQKIPMFTRIERYMNIDLLPQMHSNAHLVKFVWETPEDIDREKKREDLITLQINNGRKTLNEIRITAGDEPYNDPRADEPMPFWETAGSEGESMFDVDSEINSLLSELDKLKSLKKKNMKTFTDEEKADIALSNNIENFARESEIAIKLSIFGTMKNWFGKVKVMISSYMTNNPNASVSEGMLNAVTRMTEPGNVNVIEIRKTLEENLRIVFENAFNTNADFSETSGIFQSIPIEAIQFLKTNALLVSEKLTTDLAQRAKQTIIEGMSKGESIPKMSKRLQEVLDVSKTRAEAIARTESSKAMNEAAHMRIKRDGFEQWEFFATLDERVCKICKPLHKKHFSIENKVYLPPVHVNCRCTALSVIPEE